MNDEIGGRNNSGFDLNSIQSDFMLYLVRIVDGS